MKYSLENEKFDTCMEPSDWRYAAAIVGLEKYFIYFDEVEYERTSECIKFCRKDITQERYLKFVEYYYKEDLQHKQVEERMYQEEYTEEQIKMINDLLRGNSIMKKVFGKVKFNGTNMQEILELIDENRMDLIKETFRNKSNLYANFANTGQLFEDEKSCCRLLGYYVDGGRKSKSIAYQFDTNTFVSQDDLIFDFIPFAFTGNRVAFFINSNYSLQELLAVNTVFRERTKQEFSKENTKIKNERQVLFKMIQESSDFLNYDVEVITKEKDEQFFKTMYVRKESIQILRSIKDYEVFCFSLKVNDTYYIDVQRKVMDCILNLVRTDELIELFLKEKSEYLVFRLIDINRCIDGGGENMKQSMKVAYACAKEVVKRLPENKRESYRQKLISSIVFKDYDRFCQILLQLSNYSEVTFDFAYDLFEGFEKNKDVAYTFVNALTLNRGNENK